MSQLSKNHAVIDQKHCVACGCCTSVCPRSAITVSHGIYAVINEKACIGCGKCRTACPASVIQMEVRKS